MAMTLYKNIVSSNKPSTPEEVKDFFRNDTRIKGKRLKSFEVIYDNFGTQTDPYTVYHNVYASHYELFAVFE